MTAYHSDPSVKRKYLARVRAHRKADDIISGQYWEATGEAGRYQGCAVGCTLHSNSHHAYETELGIPEVLARLEDRLFEGLWKSDPGVARVWPEKFLAAIKPGASLLMVWPRFVHWLLVDPDAGVIRHAKREKTIAAIKNVAALYLRWISDNKPSRDEWQKAAYAAAAYAADAAAAAYAAYAADAAAADAAAAYAARKRHYSVMAEKLIELLKTA